MPALLRPGPRAGAVRRTIAGASGWDVVPVVAIGVQAAALTAWPRVVTIDGPAHLAGAAALLHSGDPSQALYEVTLAPLPNVLGTVLLAALLAVLGPDGAGACRSGFGSLSSTQHEPPLRGLGRPAMSVTASRLTSPQSDWPCCQNARWVGLA